MITKIYDELFELIRIRSKLEIIASVFHKKPYGVASFFIGMAINRINLVTLNLENEKNGIDFTNPAYEIFNNNYASVMLELQTVSKNRISPKDWHKFMVQYRNLQIFLAKNEDEFNKEQILMLRQAYAILKGIVES